MIKIVQILPAEASRFKLIRLRSLKENPEAFGTAFETAMTWEESSWVSQIERMNTLIASMDGNDIGVVRSMRDPNDARTAWIFSMWVAQEARRNQVGSKLLQSVIEWAKRENINRLRLDVVDSNGAAISLYEKHGFTPNGTTGTLPEPRSYITEHQRELVLC